MPMTVVQASHQAPSVSSVVLQTGQLQQPTMLNPLVFDGRLASVGLAADSPPSAIAGMPLISHGPSLQH